MALVFNIPQHLEDLESSSETQDRLSCQNFVPVKSLRPAVVDELVKDVIHDLSQREVLSIEDQDLFDQVYSLVRGFEFLESSTKIRLAEGLCSNLSVLIASIGPVLASGGGSAAEEWMHCVHSTRNALKIYVYFLEQVIASTQVGNPPAKQVAAKGKGRKSRVCQQWDSDAAQARFFRLLAALVLTDLKQLFGSAAREEAFFARIAKLSFSLLENPASVRDKGLKEALCVIITSCACQYGHREQSVASIVHLLHRFEHLPVHLAELVALSKERFGDTAFAVAIIHEIGRTSPKLYARDNSGVESVGLFLVELSNRLPKLVCTNLSTLMTHMDGDSYKMRSTLVQVMGVIVAKAFGDPSGNGSMEPSPSRARQALLDRLLERTRDSNSFTRSKVLQTWAGLCEQGAISIGHWNLVADIAAGRLQDKSAHVRRSALQFLATLLKFNPFGPQLRSAKFEATLDIYKKKLEEMSPPGMSDSSVPHVSSALDAVNTNTVPDASMGLIHMSNPPGECSGSGTEDFVDPSIPRTQSSQDQTPKQPLDSATQTQKTPHLDLGGLEQSRALVASLEAGLQFAKCMASTMHMLAQLLGSKVVWDVENSIHLLICCKQFEIDGSAEKVRKILPLVFAQDKDIQNAVEEAFSTLCILKSPADTASNLIDLTLDANLGDLASIEALVSKFMGKGEISQSTVARLWDMFRFNAIGVTPEQSRGALGILCMGAKTCPNILSSNVQSILDIGFGRRAKEDVLLARFACTALQRLPDEDRAKLGYNHKVFTLLSSVICKEGLPEVVWYSVAEEAINTIYMLHPTPEMFVADLVQRFSLTVFAGTSNMSVAHCISERNDSADLNLEPTTPDYCTVPASALSKFFFLVAHVALKQLVYVEMCLRNVRRQSAKKDEMLQEEANQEASKKESITAELGLVASEDARLDDLLEEAEREIVSGGKGGKTLIGLVAPVVAKLCKQFARVPQYSELWSASVLALCKLMAIDADYCEQNLQLLFTIVHTSTEEALRSNCVVALGDLSMRFPNLLEPWTEHVYSHLHDRSAAVRRNAVLVLAHLILNDMMKVKGHITELALHFEDEDDRVSSLVKLFFHELSKKGSNPIYNLLPDMISRMSSMTLPQQQFRSTLQFLLSFIEKDKQTEGLLEKLCNRFPGTTDPKQWRDVAYCISELKFSEKAMKKLIDMFKVYELALVEEEVVQHLETMMAKAKKLAKPELKAIYDEFGDKIRASHKEKKEQECTVQNANAHGTRSRKSVDDDSRLCGVDVKIEEGQDTEKDMATLCKDMHGDNLNHASDSGDLLDDLQPNGSSRAVGDGLVGTRVTEDSISSSCADGEVTEADEYGNRTQEVPGGTDHDRTTTNVYYQDMKVTVGDHEIRGSDTDSYVHQTPIDALNFEHASSEDNVERSRVSENFTVPERSSSAAGVFSGREDNQTEILNCMDRRTPKATGGDCSQLTSAETSELSFTEVTMSSSVETGEHCLSMITGNGGELGEQTSVMGRELTPNETGDECVYRTSAEIGGDSHSEATICGSDDSSRVERGEHVALQGKDELESSTSSDDLCNEWLAEGAGEKQALLGSPILKENSSNRSDLGISSTVQWSCGQVKFNKVTSCVGDQAASNEQIFARNPKRAPLQTMVNGNT